MRTLTQMISKNTMELYKRHTSGYYPNHKLDLTIIDTIKRDGFFEIVPEDISPVNWDLWIDAVSIFWVDMGFLVRVDLSPDPSEKPLSLKLQLPPNYKIVYK